MNRLANASSPYLLQHRNNPVHWWEWSDDALRQAVSEDKPIFLSIGYAACHWCHVMAHECFEDADVARVLNEGFIAIKVDREERPDIDQIYMSALHALGRQGGWPLSMFLKPDGQPFWGGTYFPKCARYGQPGFIDVLHGILSIFHNERQSVDDNGAALIEAITARQSTRPDAMSIHDLEATVDACLRVCDSVNGGTRGAPKFPNTSFLEILMRAAVRTRRPDCRSHVVRSLERMSNGGIYDHIGGGFARYAVDEIWLVPHFEKMLYDNAQLLRLLAFGAILDPTQERLFLKRIEETIGWLQRDMQTEGAYASSLDADSEGVEGKYYVWSPDEIDRIFGSGAESFKAAYDISTHGNFEGTSIPNRLKSAPRYGTESEDLMEPLRLALLAERSDRIPPGRDDKCLTDWNGYLVEALAICGFRFDHPDWIDEARRLFARLVEPHGSGRRLVHSRRHNRGPDVAIATDFAALISAGVTLASLAGDDDAMEKAKSLSAILEADFWAEPGGVFMTPRDQSNLIVRPLSDADEATPSASGLAAQAFYRLHALTGDVMYRNRADRIVNRFAAQAKENAFAYASIWNAFDTALGVVTVALFLPPDMGFDTSPFASALREALHPNMLIRVIAADTSFPADSPLFGKGMIDGKPTAFVCYGDRCLAPVFTGADLSLQLLGDKATDT